MAISSSALTSNSYIPCVCNINRQEINHRRNAGYFGLALFIVVAAGLILLPITRYARFVLFVPAFIAAIGFLQAQQKFCVGYAASGLQNVSEGSTEATAVAEARKAIDKVRARKMNLQAAGIAVMVAVIFVII